MKTFDVFDTLIARRSFTSTHIFLRIEAEFNISGFAKVRQEADRGGRDIYEIYRYIGVVLGLNDALITNLVDREIELECEDSIPIQSNIDLVSDGDVLISDMYLPGYVILDIVRKAGLRKQVTIYRSSGDKHNGKIWQALQGLGITRHLGDNEHSDCKMPRSFGIEAVHYHPGSAFIENEFVLDQAGYPWLAKMIREIRLRTRLRKDWAEFFQIALQANLPFLFILAELVNRKYAEQSVVFLGRDCQLLQKIFSSYYRKCTYLPFSRKVSFECPEASVNYLKANSAADAVFFDMSSTGATWERLDFTGDVGVAIYSDIEFYSVSRPTPPSNFSWLTKNSEFGRTSLMLEVMNCGSHGSLRKLDEIAPCFFQSEYSGHELPATLIETLHEPIEWSAKLAGIYMTNIRDELGRKPDSLLLKNFAELALFISSKNELLEKVPHFLSREKEYNNDLVASMPNS